jgi:hypothetical protein
MRFRPQVARAQGARGASCGRMCETTPTRLLLKTKTIAFVATVLTVVLVPAGSDEPTRSGAKAATSRQAGIGSSLVPPIQVFFAGLFCTPKRPGVDRRREADEHDECDPSAQVEPAAALRRRRAEAVGPAPLPKGPGTLSVTDFPTGGRFGCELRPLAAPARVAAPLVAVRDPPLLRLPHATSASLPGKRDLA